MIVDEIVIVYFVAERHMRLVVGFRRVFEGGRNVIETRVPFEVLVDQFLKIFNPLLEPYALALLNVFTNMVCLEVLELRHLEAKLDSFHASSWFTRAPVKRVKLDYEAILEVKG